jgi:hypothetical protein
MPGRVRPGSETGYRPHRDKAREMRGMQPGYHSRRQAHRIPVSAPGMRLSIPLRDFAAAVFRKLKGFWKNAGLIGVLVGVSEKLFEYTESFCPGHRHNTKKSEPFE